VSLLPILFLFLFPLLSSLFSSGDSQPAMPRVVFDKAVPPLTTHRTTQKLGVDYYVDPHDIAGWTDFKLKQLDKESDNSFVRIMNTKCELETRTKQNLYDQAQGFFFQNADKMQIAREYETPSCKRLDDLRVRR
jgi:DnaJ family protein B protein 12